MSIEPKPYDLNKPDEWKRLFRETYGFLRTCQVQHHGTDVLGRHYALDAMAKIIRDQGQYIEAYKTVAATHVAHQEGEGK